MTLALLIVLGALALAAIMALAVVTVQARTSPGPSLAGRTLVLHTRDGKTIRGILFAQHADRLTLREAVYVHVEGETAIAGLAHVPTSSIAWLQELGG